MKANRSWHLFSGLVGIVAGLWGVIVVLLFVFSQITMGSGNTSLLLSLGAYGVAGIYLGLQLAFFVGAIVVSFLEISSYPSPDRKWLLLLAVLSILLIVINLIPGSTMGLLVLPASVGVLASSLLFLATRPDNNQQAA